MFKQMQPRPGNHTFFFDTLTPQQPEMPQPLTDALTRDFGSVETFKEKFTQAATTLFGSGWTWLVSDKDGHLSIVSESNAGNPLKKGTETVTGYRRVGACVLH